MISTLKNKKLSLLFILFLLFFLTGEAVAEIGLSVSPQRQELTIFPGDSYSGEFKIHNPNSISLPVTVKATPFGAEEGTGDIVLGQDERGENPQRWINFEETEMLLSPGENKRLAFEVDIPADAPEGGYYIFTHFQVRIPDFEEGSSTRAVPSVGVPFMIATTELALDYDDEEEDGLMEVREFAISSENRSPLFERVLNGRVAFTQTAWADDGLDFRVTRGQPDEFILEIQNNDSFHIQPKGSLAIYDALDRKILETDFTGQTILPGKSRRFNLKIDNEKKENSGSFLSNIYADLMRGSYRARLDIKGVSPLRGEVAPSGDMREIPFFSTAPFFFWLLILLAIVILILMRKRIKMATKVLVGFTNKKYEKN